MDSDSSSSSNTINIEEIDSSSQSSTDNAMDCDDEEKIDDPMNVGPIVRRWMYDNDIQNSDRKLQCTITEYCRFLCTTSEALIWHLELAHNFKVDKRVVSYQSMSEFDVWKAQEEMQTHTKYCYKGVEKTKDGIIYKLRCKMSAPLRSEDEIQQRKKKQGKREFELLEWVGICPSSIQLTEMSDGTVKGIYYIDHLGHDLEHGSVPNMYPERLAEQLCRNWSPSLEQSLPPKIGKYLHTKKESVLSKLKFWERRDIDYTEEFLKYFERDNEEDIKMIHDWVQKFNLDRKYGTPIVVYRRLAKFEDFIMIILHQVQMEAFLHTSLDCTLYVKIKKGEENVDLNMTAVNIITAGGEPLPLAFCLTPRVEYITFYYIYHTIYEHYGSIRPKVFVSDNLSQSYLAWNKVMPPITNPKMCVFDLESIWQYTMMKRKVPVDKQQVAAAQLKYLLYESDKETFFSQLYQILGEWNEDVSMKSFARFFKRNYANKCEEWAGCFRTDPDTLRTIDDHLELVNTILDAIYILTYTGITDLLNYIMIYIRDSCLPKVIELDERYRWRKDLKTRINHIEGNKIIRVRNDGSSWNVCDVKYGIRNYVVKTAVNDCKQDCGIFCSVCNVCIHQYSCPCKDFVIAFNLCRHIHAELGAELDVSEQPESTLPYDDYVIRINSLPMIFGYDRNGCFVYTSYGRDSILSQTDSSFGDVWKPDLELVTEFEAPGGILSMAASENMLYTCSTDQSIQSWDLNAMKNAGKVSTCLFQPQKLYVDKATNILWAGDSQGNVAKFEEGEECGKFELVEEIWDLMVTSSPNLVYTARDRDVVVSELITNNGRPRVMIKGTFQGRSPFCIAGNNFCFLDREGRNIIVHENNVAEKFPRLKEIVASELIINALTPATGDIVYSGGYDSTVKKWDLKSSNCLGSVNLGCCINALSCLSENELYIAKSDGVVSKVGI